MRIAIVGGIFDKAASYRAKHAISPETTLVDGLRASGLSVTPFGHRTYLSAGAFDIVHIHHYGRALFAALKHSRHARVIFTSHDPYLMNGLPISPAKRLTYASVMRSADCIIALSKREAEYLTRRYGVHPESVRVIHNGINTNVFAPRPGRREDDHLLFVGQLEPFKGLDYLIAALPRVRDARPSVRLTVVYQTAAKLDQYRALARRHGVEDVVVFAGPKSPAELADLYSECTVLVSPSLGECLSTVVLEGMACGCAIVATDVGGIREQLDASTGVIVPPADVTAISDAVAGLLGDPRKRASLGAGAADSLREKFSVDAMVTAHIHMYGDILSRARRPMRSRDRLISALVGQYTKGL
jgi:glycosyltransferase involved in cell wall biosynthesis